MDHYSRYVKYLIFAAVAGAVVYFIARPYFVRSGDLAWEHTVATYPGEGAPQALVHGWTNAPLGKCHFSLLWKAGEDKWLVFDVDENGGAWDHYQLRMEGDSLAVLLNGKAIGLFDPAKSEYRHLADKQVDKAPAAVIHGANLDHEKQWAYYSGGK